MDSLRLRILLNSIATVALLNTYATQNVQVISLIVGLALLIWSCVLAKQRDGNMVIPKVVFCWAVIAMVPTAVTLCDIVGKS